MRQHATGLGRAGTGRRLPVFALVLLSASASAMEKPDGNNGNKGFEAGPPANSIREPPRAAGESKDRVVRDLERKYGAKVLKGPKEREIDGRKVLVLTLIDDKKGRVWEVRVDPQTGEEL